MKYKQKKTSVSKYISAKEKEEKSKKTVLKKQVTASIIFVMFMLSLPAFGVVKRPIIKSVFGYVSKATDVFSADKIINSGFLKKTGEHIYDFCFGYLKGNDTSNISAYAIDKKTEAKKEAAVAQSVVKSDSEVLSDAQFTSADEKILKFEPIWPCEGEISSEFGSRVHPVSGETKFHNGIDIAVAEGTEIFACEDGTIDTATFNDYSGNYVVISHEGGYTSSYSHMFALGVAAGMEVKKGEVIGLAGSTGIATGPHLHFEIKQDGTCKDPKEFIEK